MSLAQFSTAAADAPVGTDLLQNVTQRSSTMPRRLSGVGLAGSAAALDTQVDVYAGDTRVGSFFNSATGAVLRDQHVYRVGAYIPAGEEVSAIVVDAPASSPINGVFDFQDL